MRIIVLICVLLLSNVCKAQEYENKLRVVNTFIGLAFYNPIESLKIIDAIKRKDKNCDSLGSKFVKDVYEKSTELDTTECKIIWKAILVSCRSKEDGFILMDIPTPWLK